MPICACDTHLIKISNFNNDNRGCQIDWSSFRCQSRMFWAHEMELLIVNHMFPGWKTSPWLTSNHTASLSAIWMLLLLLASEQHSTHPCETPRNMAHHCQAAACTHSPGFENFAVLGLSSWIPCNICKERMHGGRWLEHCAHTSSVRVLTQLEFCHHQSVLPLTVQSLGHFQPPSDHQSWLSSLRHLKVSATLLLCGRQQSNLSATWFHGSAISCLWNQLELNG